MALSPMEAQKSPRKDAKRRKSRENVLEIDGVEIAVETEKTRVPRSKQGKKKVVMAEDDEEEDDDDVKLLVSKGRKRLSRKFETDDDEEEEEFPISRKEGKVSVQESDHLDADRLSDGVTGFETAGGEDENDVEMVKDEEGEDGVLAVPQEDDMLLTQLSGFQTQDTDDGDVLETQEQDRRIKPRVRMVSVTSLYLI